MSRELDVYKCLRLITLGVSEDDWEDVPLIAQEALNEIERLTEECAATRAEFAEALSRHAADQAEINRLLRLLYILCEEVEDTDQHGSGAHDDGCPICCAIAEVHKLSPVT